MLSAPARLGILPVLTFFLSSLLDEEYMRKCGRRRAAPLILDRLALIRAFLLAISTSPMVKYVCLYVCVRSGGIL